MSIFSNWFNRRGGNFPTFEETNNPNSYDLREYPPMPEVNQPKKADQCFYTVGRSEHGNTVLKVHADDGYGSMTLTMNEAATRQMIRMLEATLIMEEDDVAE